MKIGWVVKHHNYRGGLSKAGNRRVLGRGAAGGRPSSNQSLGKSAKMRTRLSFEIQNEVETRGREGKSKQSLLMDSDRVGPHLMGGLAHVSGQNQGDFEGPNEVKNGEQSYRPSERHCPAMLRVVCKGRIGGTTSLANPSCSGSKECEALAVEEKGSQETISLQGQGCSDIGEDDGNYCVSEKESPSDKFLEKLPFGAEQEHDGEKVGSHLGAVDLACNDRRDETQEEEKVKQSSRDPGLKLACLRAEEEGEVDKRAGRSVDSHGEELGNIDEIWVTSSSRVHPYRKGEQVEKLPMSGQTIEEGRGLGQGLEPDLDTCWVHGSSSDPGQNFWATQSPISIKRASFNGITIYEPTYFKAQTETLKTGLGQDLVSKADEMSRKLEPISSSLEAGQERMTSALEEEDELSEAAGQPEGHNIKKRYDDNLFSQSTSIPFSVFGRPLLSGGSSGLRDSLMENALPLRVVAADGKEWGPESPCGIIDEVEETGAGGHRKEAQCESVENWNYGSWESSCLVKFSEFLGFSTKGFEKEILKLLRNLVDSQNLSKEKGSLTVSKSERELRRLRSTINYNGNRINKGGGRDRGNLLLKLK